MAALLLILCIIGPVMLAAARGYAAGKPPSTTNTHTLDAYRAAKQQAAADNR